MVAKSFQHMQIVGSPYEKGNKTYVKVKTSANTEREVRWYTDAEYMKMYPGQPIDHSNDPFYRSQKDTLGFENGYITIFKGSTYEYKEWFKEHGARYTKFWGWSFGSTVEVPDPLPTGIEPVKLSWELVGDGDKLKPEDKVKMAVDTLLLGEDPSEFVGNVGDKGEYELTITAAIPMEGYYGSSIMHVMKDKNDNVFVWTTAARKLTVGETYLLKGTIKDHKTYKRTKQTILTRCRVISSTEEEKEIQDEASFSD